MVATPYRTGRFTKVGRLSKALRVLTPVDRGPGRRWRPGTPAADIRIGYARCSTLTQQLQSQLDALAAHGIPRDKIFSEKISTRMRVRPQFEAAHALACGLKAHAPHCRAIFTVNEMKRLGRDAAEFTALADHLVAHGPVLEMPAGPRAPASTPVIVRPRPVRVPDPIDLERDADAAQLPAAS